MHPSTFPFEIWLKDASTFNMILHYIILGCSTEAADVFLQFLQPFVHCSRFQSLMKSVNFIHITYEYDRLS